MAGTASGNPALYFGKMVRKERQACGWTVHELSVRTGIAAPHLSRVENGRRPPTERIAIACDTAFGGSFFADWYRESQTWAEVPATFRDWPEHEDTAARLGVWCPSIMHGLLQTEEYARALIAVHGVSDEVAAARLTARMQRQQRVLYREKPPAALFIVDELALYRRVGSAEVMAGQLQHLADMAALPGITIQVMPAIEYPATASGFILADDAAWCEHVAAGYVLVLPETVSVLAASLDKLRGECYRVSESVAMFGRMRDQWATGASPLTLAATAGTASR